MTERYWKKRKKKNKAKVNKGKEKPGPQILPTSRLSLGLFTYNSVSTNGIGSVTGFNCPGFISRAQPIYLPLETQLKILNMLQSLLEGCCLEFGGKWVPKLMEAKNWTEPGSVELNCWVAVILRHRGEVSDAAFKNLDGKSWDQILLASRNIRHAAVHRHRVDVHELLNFLRAGEDFAEVLRNEEKLASVKRLRIHLEGLIGELVQSEESLKKVLAEEVAEIEKKKAALKELEREAVERMENMNAGNVMRLGQDMDAFIKNMGNSILANADVFDEDSDIEEVLLAAEALIPT